MGQTLLLNFCIGLGSESFYLAGMLLRFLVVVDAHEKDVIGAESIIAFIDVCTHLFSQISRHVNCDKKVVVKISTAERMCRSGE